jgi:hypothetical protein
MSAVGMPRIWNGGFIIGEIFNPSVFIASGSYIYDMDVPLSYVTVNAVGRVGPDTLGTSMQLSKPVKISFKGLNPDTGYTILSSVDGINWRRQEA